MATIIDWPTTDAFRSDSPLRVGLGTSKSGLTGFYTGNRETLAHLADRLTLQLPLPPCTAAQAGEREAFLMAGVSAGYWYRFGMPHRRVPVGNLRGSPTTSGTTAAGARTMTLTNCIGKNLLLGSSFEVDTNGDGIADLWSSFSAGTTGTLTYTRNTTSPVSGTWRQSCAAGGLGTTGSDSFGLFRDLTVSPSTDYTLSAYITITVGPSATHTVTIQWRDSGGSFISANQTATVGSGGAFARYSVTATSPSNAASARIIITTGQRTSSVGATAFVVDAVQFEAGSLSDYSPGATLVGGDFIGIGGNLLMAAYGGATASDAGVMTLPLAVPVQKAISSGTAVAWSGPTGVWELDMDAIDLSYLGTWLQEGTVLQFRQRIV